MLNNSLQLSILNVHMETKIFWADRRANGPTEEGKICCSIICDLVSNGFGPEFFYFPYQKRFLTSPVGFALTSAALRKIKFIIPNTTREKEYVQIWTARLWQSPNSTTTVPTVQTQHSLGYMNCPWILDSGAFTPVAANGKKCVEAKWSSKVVFPLSLWAFRAV